MNVQTSTGGVVTVPSLKEQMDVESLTHLLARLQLIEHRVRRAITNRRATDPNAEDPFRGLYLTDEHVNWILESTVESRTLTPELDEMEALARAEVTADLVEQRGAPTRLRRLMQGFDLVDLDVELLLVGMAPDVDPRFERLYGYLNDDVSRRRATVGLAFELCGLSPFDARARSRLAHGAPLTRAGLACLDDADRPFLSRTLLVPDRVTAYLLGDKTPDPALGDVLVDVPPLEMNGSVVERALNAGASVVYLKDRPGSAARSAAVDGLARHGLAAVVLDLERVVADPDPEFRGEGRWPRSSPAGCWTCGRTRGCDGFDGSRCTTNVGCASGTRHPHGKEDVGPEVGSGRSCACRCSVPVGRAAGRDVARASGRRRGRSRWRSLGDHRPLRT